MSQNQTVEENRRMAENASMLEEEKREIGYGPVDFRSPFVVSSHYN